MRSASCRTLQAGSLRSPETSWRPAPSSRDSSTQIENGHANGETVGDLIEDDALQSVGDVAVDLDPAVDRTWVHDEAIRFQKLCAFFCQAKQTDIFTDSGKIFSALALVLNSQKVYDIDFRQHVIDRVRNFNPEFFKLARDKRARSDERHARAKFQQAEDVRARNATK